MEVKSLTFLAMRTVLINADAPNFRIACEFLHASGLAPQRLTVQYLKPKRWSLRFFSKCDRYPMQLRFREFGLVLQYLARLGVWRVQSIEFIRIPFDIGDIVGIELALARLDAELVQISDCRYPGVAIGEETLRLDRVLQRRRFSAIGGVRLRDLVQRSHELVQAQEQAHLNQVQQVNQPNQQDEVEVDPAVPQIDNARRRQREPPVQNDV